MVLSASVHSDKQLMAIKFNGKWRMASRFAGKLRIEYEVDTKAMRLYAAYGNMFFSSLFGSTPFIVDDYAFSIRQK